MKKTFKILLLLIVTIVTSRAELFYKIPCGDLTFLKDYETVCKVNPNNYIFKQKINYNGVVKVDFENGDKTEVESKQGFELKVKENVIFVFTVSGYTSPRLKLYISKTTGLASWKYYFTKTKRWRTYVFNLINITTTPSTGTPSIVTPPAVKTPVKPIVVEPVVVKPIVVEPVVTPSLYRFDLKRPFMGNVDTNIIHTGFTPINKKDFTYDLTFITKGSIPEVLQVSGMQDIASKPKNSRMYIGVYKKKVLFGLGNTTAYSSYIIKPNTTYNCKIIYQNGKVNVYVNNVLLVKDRVIDMSGKLHELYIGGRNLNGKIDRVVKSYHIYGARIRDGIHKDNIFPDIKRVGEPKPIYKLTNRIIWGGDDIEPHVKGDPYRGIVVVKSDKWEYTVVTNENGEFNVDCVDEGEFTLAAWGGEKWYPYPNKFSISSKKQLSEFKDGEWHSINKLGDRILTKDLTSLSAFKGDKNAINFKNISSSSFSLTPDPKQTTNRGAKITLPTKVGMSYAMFVNVNKKVRIYFSELLPNGKYKSLRDPAVISGVNKAVPIHIFKATGKKAYFYFAPLEEGEFIMRKITLKEVK